MRHGRVAPDGVLVGFRNRIRQQDIELVLVHSAACVLRLLKITGLDQEFALT
jgi:anti-anti-sigma regulatory factor